MSRRSVVYGMAVSSLVFLLAGCGGGRDANLPDREPVSGLVTLSGEPLSGASVEFIPVGGTPGTGASGSTGADGRFELASQHGKGVPAGEYRVVVSKMVTPDGSTPPPNVPPADANAHEMLPPKYSDYEGSELKKTVPAGGGTIDIELTK